MLLYCVLECVINQIYFKQWNLFFSSSGDQKTPMKTLVEWDHFEHGQDLSQICFLAN